MEKVPGGPRTFFATHFHELVSVVSSLPRVRNYHFAVKETGKDVTFLRKLIPGATDRSYGIHVARLAGVPRQVTERASVLMKEAVRYRTQDGHEAARVHPDAPCRCP